MSNSLSPVSLHPEQVALQRQGRDLAHWLIIVPLVLLLLFGCSQLALLAAPPLPSVDTRSKLQANYEPWSFATIPAINAGIVDEIAHDQATKVSQPVTLPASFWSTPTPTSLIANPPQTTATLSGSASPVRTATPLSTSTRQPTATTIVTLTRTPKPTLTWTSTATRTRTLVPLATRTPTSAPTSTFTPVPPPTNTSAPPPPPPPTATRTRTPTPIFSPTATRTATTPPVFTNTPTATATPTETFTPGPPVCLISGGGLGASGSTLSWSVTNSDVVTVNLTSVSASWAQPGDVWQSLDFGGSTVWSGLGINAPGGGVSPSGAVDLPPGSKSLSFNFNNLTSGVTYAVSASFDNGCTINSGFTNP